MPQCLKSVMAFILTGIGRRLTVLENIQYFKNAYISGIEALEKHSILVVRNRYVSHNPDPIEVERFHSFSFKQDAFKTNL